MNRDTFNRCRQQIMRTLPPSTRKRIPTFLVSFPKSGRTWLRLMIGHVMRRHYNLSIASPYELMELHELHQIDPSRVPPVKVRHDDKVFWRTPRELSGDKRKYRRTKVIFLVRDPRDVLVSSYFEKKKRSPYLYDKWQPIDDIHSYIRDERGSTQTLIAFYNIWARERHVPADFLLVRYEDLYTDPERELARVCQFIGMDNVANDLVTRAVANTTFESMKRLEQEERTHYRLSPTNKRDRESYKIRRGKVGGYDDYLSPDDITYVNHYLSELNPFFGYRV